MLMIPDIDRLTLRRVALAISTRPTGGLFTSAECLSRESVQLVDQPRYSP